MRDKHLEKIIFIVSTGFGSGLSPVVPGTIGTIAAFALLAVLQAAFPVFRTIEAVLLLALCTSAVGIYASGEACKRKLFGESKDPRPVVIDEFAGFFVSAAGFSDLPHLLLAFVWFRVFDALKPPPVRNLEKLPGGWGIVLDDLAAGLLAAFAARLCMLAAS